MGLWQRGAVIGRGASATVSVAVDCLTGDVFAVKSTGIALAGLLRHEQSVLSALASPYVVSCIGGGEAADGSGAVCYDLFLELAPGGSLADETKRCGGRCEEPLIRSRAGDVLRGLVYIHGAGVAHCDVKARNVLLGADGRAKLADFGCARWTADDDCNAGGATVIRGTPMFLAPEAARGETQGTAADIWALGCTVIEMATGGAPWPRFADPVAALHHVAHSGEVPETPLWFSDEGKNFLARCLVRDPTERWTAEQLLEHPFVTSSPANPPTPKGTPPMEQWVSPKSILDQSFWDHSSSTVVTSTVALTAADRLRSLASSAWTSDWTWSGEDWITVCGVAEPKLEAGGGSSGERTGTDSRRGDGASHGHHEDASVISSSCNIELCSNSGSKSNGLNWNWNWIKNQLYFPACSSSCAPLIPATETGMHREAKQSKHARLIREEAICQCHATDDERKTCSSNRRTATRRRRRIDEEDEAHSIAMLAVHSKPPSLECHPLVAGRID